MKWNIFFLFAAGEFFKNQRTTKFSRFSKRFFIISVGDTFMASKSRNLRTQSIQRSHSHCPSGKAHRK